MEKVAVTVEHYGFVSGSQGLLGDGFSYFSGNFSLCSLGDSLGGSAGQGLALEVVNKLDVNLLVGGGRRCRRCGRGYVP